MPASEQLDWEARWRMRTVLSAALAALLILSTFAVGAAGAHNDVTELTTQLLFVHRHSGNFLLSSVLLSLGSLALVLPLLYLYRAVKFRREQLQPVARIAGVGGAAALGVLGIVVQVVLVSKADRFATHGSQTYDEAKRLIESTGFQVLQSLTFAAQIAIGFALVMISLNAMRVGLLTRFMGIIGILVGVFTVLQQLLPPAPILEAFWLGALAYLISGRWPSGVPPSWSSGKAEPWPSQQELRESREREKGAAAEPAPATAQASSGSGSGAGRQHVASKKRKRKKRR